MFYNSWNLQFSTFFCLDEIFEVNSKFLYQDLHIVLLCVNQFFEVNLWLKNVFSEK